MSAPASRNRILVVDDDPAIRRMLQRSLELAGFDVAVACGGEEGLALLRRDPGIGLVLVDLVMPGMDGWTFLREQRADASLAAIPTIILSGSALAPPEELAAAPFLRKPVSRDHLIALVASYCTPRPT